MIRRFIRWLTKHRALSVEYNKRAPDKWYAPKSRYQ